MIKKLSILILVENDKTNIRLILDKIEQHQFGFEVNKEVLIVNLSRSNNPVAVLENYNAQDPEFSVCLCDIDLNKRKGEVVQKAIQRCSGEFLLIQDLSLHFDSAIYTTLLIPVFKGGADVVYGSRYKGGNSCRTSSLFNDTFSKILTRVSNVFTNLNLTDVNASYKLIRTDIAKCLALEEECLAIELIAKLSRVKEVKIYEVGIPYHGDVSKVKSRLKWGNGIREIYSVLKCNLLKKIKLYGG